MPLWKIYHPVGAFSLEDKKGLSEAITALYARGLPKFYVGVVFQEVAADSFFIGGEGVDNFVRIWIDHIARTMPTPEIRARFIQDGRRGAGALRPRPRPELGVPHRRDVL